MIKQLLFPARSPCSHESLTLSMTDLFESLPIAFVSGVKCSVFVEFEVCTRPVLGGGGA